MHGWGGSTVSFYGLAKQLSAAHRVTLVDFYGFGETPHPDYPLTLDNFVSSVIDLINFYEMKDVSIVGHSFGGRIALKLACKYGYLLDKMVLIDSAGIRPRRGIKYYYKVFSHKIFTKLKIPHKAGSADYRSLNSVRKKTFVNIVNENLRPILKNITLPTLIIWGEKDKDTPMYMAKILHREISGSGLVVHKGAGHYSYLDCPRETYLILNSFFGEV